MNQISVNPYGPQTEIQKFNTEHNVLTAAYSPLGRGGELLEDATLTRIGEEHGKSPAQVVLRWHLQQGRIAVPRSSNPERQAENLAVLDFELTPAELEAIDALNRNEAPRLDADEFGH